jgi:hypothetical protein
LFWNLQIDYQVKLQQKLRVLFAYLFFNEIDLK